MGINSNNIAGYYFLLGGGVTWDSCPEVIHIEQILGNYVNYAHESV